MFDFILNTFRAAKRMMLTRLHTMHAKENFEPEAHVHAPKFNIIVMKGAKVNIHHHIHMNDDDLKANPLHCIFQANIEVRSIGGKPKLCSLLEGREVVPRDNV